MRHNATDGTSLYKNCVPYHRKEPSFIFTKHFEPKGRSAHRMLGTMWTSKVGGGVGGGGGGKENATQKSYQD